MESYKIDDIIRNYLRTEDVCLYDDFEYKVMSLCEIYTLKKKRRYCLFRNLVFVGVVSLIMILVLFTPLNGYLIYLLGRITLIGLIVYYIISMIITTSFFYVILLKFTVYRINRSVVP
jgi:hypothetical protein